MGRKKARREGPADIPVLPCGAREAVSSIQGEGLLVVAAWILLAALLTMTLVGDWKALAGNQANFAGPGKPLLHEYDGYYYLRLARDIREGRYARRDPLRAQSRPVPPPPLSLALAGASIVSPGSLEMTAAALPPVLALGLPILLGFCGRLMSNRWFGVLAALASCSTLYLYSRTCFGYFDTDCLNPFFVLLLPLFIYHFTLHKGQRRWLWLAGWGGCLGVFLWWWPQGASVAAGLSLLGYALSFSVPSPRWERLLKYGLLFILGIALLVLVLEFLGMLESGIPAFKSMIVHMKLILGGSGQAQSVGGSIQELASQLPSSVLEDLSAFIGTVLLAEVGLVGLVAVHRRFSLCLLPLLAFASASFFSQRFMIFTAPLYGMGYAYFYVLVVERAPWMRSRRWAGIVLAGLMAGLLMPSYARNLEWHSTPPLSSRDIPLVEAVNSAVPASAKVWAWWDYGYFLQYMARRPTLCDGGLTSEDAVLPLAVPFAVSDPVVAARWIRFVGEYGVDGWLTFSQQAGGVRQAANLLVQAFARPDESKALALSHGLVDDRDWKTFLRPQTQACLYLNRNTIDLAYWWFTFGIETLQGPGRTPRELVDRQPLDAFAVDYAVGVFTRRADRAVLKVAEVVDVRPAGIARYPADPSARAAAVVYREEGLVYFVARELLDTVAFRLLYAPLGQALPGFTPVFRDPVAGGAWWVTG